MPTDRFDLKSAVHPRKGGGMDVRQVKHAAPSGSAMTPTKPSPKVPAKGKRA